MKCRACKLNMISYQHENKIDPHQVFLFQIEMDFFLIKQTRGKKWKIPKDQGTEIPPVRSNLREQGDSQVLLRLISQQL